MHNIEVNNKQYSFPERWSEFSKNQILYMVSILNALNSGELTPHDFKVLLVFKILNIKQKNKSDYSVDDQVNISLNIYRLTELLDFIFEEKEGKIFFKFDSIINYLPVVRNLIGPQAGLVDCCFGEFRNALIFSNLYSNSVADGNENIEYLDLLVASIYRPRKKFLFVKKRFDKYSDDDRVSFNASSIKRRAKNVAKIGYVEKYAIYLFFKNNVRYISNSEIEIGDQVVDFSDLFSSSERSNGKSLGLLGVLYKMAEVGTFGNIEQTDASNLYDVLLKMLQWKYDYDDQKRKMNKNG